jgi:adenosine deaminase
MNWLVDNNVPRGVTTVLLHLGHGRRYRQLSRRPESSSASFGASTRTLAQPLGRAKSGPDSTRQANLRARPAERGRLARLADNSRAIRPPGEASSRVAADVDWTAMEVRSNVQSDAVGGLDPELADLIDRLPKVELHVHLEGTLEPQLAFRLAARNGVALPYASVEETRAAYDFSDLQSFLDVYYAACTVLVTREDFRELTRAYLERAHADRVRHVEPFFDPQTHTTRGIPIGDVIGGILDGLADGERELGITSGLILSFLRHLPAEAADATLAAAEPWLDRIVAVGLDSSEVGFPPEPFAGTFARARSLGLRAVAHAGEEGDASFVARTVEALGVSRIDHGVRAADDPAVMRRLAEGRVTLTACPNSNVRLRVFPSMERSTIRTLMEAGVAVTINSDDPAYFGGYIGDNYRRIAAALALTAGDLGRLAANAINGSFATPARKQELLAELARAIAR